MLNCIQRPYPAARQRGCQVERARDVVTAKATREQRVNGAAAAERRIREPYVLRRRPCETASRAAAPPRGEQLVVEDGAVPGPGLDARDRVFAEITSGCDRVSFAGCDRCSSGCAEDVVLLVQSLGEVSRGPRSAELRQAAVHDRSVRRHRAVERQGEPLEERLRGLEQREGDRGSSTAIPRTCSAPFGSHPPRRGCRGTVTGVAGTG